MGITILHLGLAAGVALAAIPVILHLFMRQTPKKVIFPALQLLKNRHRQTKKRLRIKNWLLLLSRMALLALMALALARPACSTKASLGDREVPTAVALVFDTSYSMQYTERGKDRLAEAKKLADEKLRRISDSSVVYVIDSADPQIAPLSPSAARKRLEGLSLRPANLPLNFAVGQAYVALSQADLPRRVVYVLTDLARSAWDVNRPAEHLDAAGKVKGGISTFIVRLGAKKVEDVGIVEAEPVTRLGLSADAAVIKVRLHSAGAAAKRNIDMYIDGRKRSEKPVAIPADGEVELELETPKLEPGPHQGEVSLSGGVDSLPFDDKRFFSFDIQPALKALIVSDLVVDAEFVSVALEISESRKAFEVDSMLTTEPGLFMSESLKSYACIFLVNVAALTEAQWSRLNAYVHEGGGLVVAAGDRNDAESYASTVARGLMPCALKEPVTPAKPASFAKFDAMHPIFSNFADGFEKVLPIVPIYRYWKVEPAENARTILTYLDGAPALLERGFSAVGSGKVLFWTTPLARRADRTTERDLREGWNDFPLVWPFLAITRQSVSYLAGRSGRKLNYEAGEDVIVPINPQERFSNYMVQGPKNPLGDQSNGPDRLTPPANKSSLVVVAPQPEGNWSVTAGNGAASSNVVERFSVNIPESETRFIGLETRDLDAMFGRKNHAVAETLEDLKEIETAQWIGKEVFPWLMAIVVACVVAEGVLANRFYRIPQVKPLAA